MKKVYVAGAYSDDNVLGVLRNIGRGEYFASLLFQNGFAPFTPWHDKSFVITHWDCDFTVKMFYDYSIEWLRVSDILFVIPNHEGLTDYQDSKGTIEEIKIAKELGIPIYYDMFDLINENR